MTEADLAGIESKLGIKFPTAFRRFMLDHGDALARARKLLRDEVVWETAPAMEPQKINDVPAHEATFGVGALNKSFSGEATSCANLVNAVAARACG